MEAVGEEPEVTGGVCEGDALRNWLLASSSGFGRLARSGNDSSLINICHRGSRIGPVCVVGWERLPVGVVKCFMNHSLLFRRGCGIYLILFTKSVTLECFVYPWRGRLYMFGMLVSVRTIVIFLYLPQGKRCS